ncbi:GGDEF domain-containing protein [Neptuniibacter sp. PT8_73]|uniref:GGDEF domain-containing protein n=1 Tax=Neptuniibacter sp. PT8_73 TaxID=3398206 RepID=UPI0039F5AE97
MKTSAPTSPRVPLLLTGATALLCLLLLLYIHLSAQSTLQKYIPWLDASMEIKLEVAQAHLWFEEISAGDHSVSVDTVYTHLDQATWYANAILDGGTLKQNIYQPLEYKELRLQANRLVYRLQQLRKSIDQRYLNLEEALAGTEEEQRQDKIFIEIIQKANALESSLKLRISYEDTAQNSLLALLLLAIVTMTLISGYSVHRFTDSRTRYMQKLALANTQISEQNRRLQELAHTDQLTGLPNRKMLEAITKQAISRAQRKQSTLSLTFIDLDFFKPINDEYGHNVGDKVLTNFTTAINQILREDDILARLAGDEFILLIQADSMFEAQEALDHIMERIHERLDHPIIDTPAALHIRCSAGTAFAPKDAIDFEGLLHCADIAMYESKKRGRGQHCYFTPSPVAQSELPLSMESREMEAANR